MPVYHFTIHAYRSWRPDHARGYVRKGKGYLALDPKMAQAYDEAARQSPSNFATQVQSLMIHIAQEFCTRSRFRLHAIGNEFNHVHFVLSWRGFLPWYEVMRRLKGNLSATLNKRLNCSGRRWFVRGGSRKRVTSARHLEHLVTEYLPNHSGVFWREGQPLPELPAG